MAEEAPPGPKGLSVDMPPTEEGACHVAPFPVGSIKSGASRGMLQQKCVCVEGAQLVSFVGCTSEGTGKKRNWSGWKCGVWFREGTQMEQKEP